jgi:aquaporin Z
MCIAPLTGAGLNPARAFGPALWGGFGPAGDWILAFVIGPVAGAVVAAQLYTAVVLARQPSDAKTAAAPSRDGEGRPVTGAAIAIN